MDRTFGRRVVCCILAALLLIFALAGCQEPVNVDESGAATAQDYPVTVNDLTLSARPGKVVVLSDSLADVILAIGYETTLAAAADTCDQSDFATLRKVSPTESQGIVDLGADLVLATSFTPEQEAAFTEAAIPYTVIQDAQNREDFERLYSQIGSLLGGASTGYNDGVNAARRLFTTLDDLSRVIPHKNTVVTACYLFDTEGHAVTGDMLASTIMDYSGITNVFKGSTDGTYDFENLRITNPLIIFCPIGMRSVILENTEFQQLKAVETQQVYEVDERYVRRSGRNVINAATTFAGIAYPELLEENSNTVTMPEDSSEESSLPEESSDSSEPGESSVPTDVEPAGEPIMQPGDNSEEVLAVQERLAELGYLTVEYDGLYGDLTAQAVKAFQQANHLEDTGNVDEKTLEVLNSDAAIPAPESPETSEDSEDPENSEDSGSEDSGTDEEDSGTSEDGDSGDSGDGGTAGE